MIAIEHPAPERGLRATLTIVSAPFALGVAAWLSASQVDIVSWPQKGIGRVALFAPLYMLWIAFAASAIGAGLLWFVGSNETRRHRAFIVAPLGALWIWTLPYLPWLAERMPLLLILAGPLRWLIAALAVLGVGLRWMDHRGWLHLPQRLPGRKTAFVLSLVLYLLVGFRSLSIIGLGGDEPHYLVITHSLLVDHDLAIENNHARRDYRAFFGGNLRPDYLRRGVNGQIYSIHAPGLPALLGPGYALWGSRGAIATMALLAAIAGLAIFDMAALVGGTAAAWGTWVSLCLTVPFIPHAWAIYPEIAGAAIVAWTVLWSMRPPPASPAVWLARGCCLAALPWLHTKFVLFLVGIALWLLIRLRGRLKDSIAMLAPIAVSGVAWLAFFYVIYGTLDPEAPYGTYMQQYVRLENIPRSVLGVLFDQKFGLFVYAPIYLVGAVGAWLLVKDKRWRGTAIALVSMASLYSLSSARLYMWWGGSSAPARFLVPVVPLAAPMIAVVWSRMRGATATANLWLLALLSVLIAAGGVLGFGQLLLMSDPHGVARIAEALQGSAPLTAAVPTFTDQNWRAPLVGLLPWLAAAAVSLVAARAAASRWRLSTWSLVMLEGTVFLVVAAWSIRSFSENVRAESVMRGHVALMNAFDPVRLRAFDYSTRSKLLPPAWLSASRITIDLDPGRPADAQGRLIGPLTLPPGRYEVRVWFRSERPREGDLLLALGRGRALQSTRLAGLPNPVAMTFELPLPVRRLWVELSEQSSARDVMRVELTPIALVPRTDRPRVEPRAAESIPFRPNAYLVYADDWTFPEGGIFWTRGTHRGEVLVAPAGGGEILLTLHVGPFAGTVRVVAAGQVSVVEMSPNQTKTLSIAVPSGTAYVPISVESPGWFRPVDVDPGSTDARSLGCQVRVEVR